ncbi:MAG: carboxypeptidase-like regulatory domain-containing protein [Hymenobacter sp.]
MDDIRYGKTDDSGKLEIKTVSTGRHSLRVRADGFKQSSQNLLPAQKGEIKIALTKTTDEAELAFQEAERTLTLDREKTAELYRKAMKLRPPLALSMSCLTAKIWSTAAIQHLDGHLDADALAYVRQELAQSVGAAKEERIEPLLKLIERKLPPPGAWGR